MIDIEFEKAYLRALSSKRKHSEDFGDTNKVATRAGDLLHLAFLAEKAKHEKHWTVKLQELIEGQQVVVGEQRVVEPKPLKNK